ncbi:MAG: sulfatase [Planctomycetes bacterium]|nr:sulfatase [Planctomycetota bacterium]
MIVALLGLIAFAPQVNADIAAAERPNIIFIYSDDHAEAAVSACGSEITRTPRLDELAAQGVRFSQSFVANSICGPARATILTGLHSHANGRVSNGTPFRDDLPSWPKLLLDSGYRTAMYGKWHLPTDPNGFGDWGKVSSYYTRGVQTAEGFIERRGYSTDLITDLSLEWIDGQPKDQPFAIWINYHASHRTWLPATRYLGLFDDHDIPEPPTLFPDFGGKSPAAALTQMRISEDLFPAYDLKLPVTGDQILDRAAENRMAPMTKEQRAAWDDAYGLKNAAFAEASLEGQALVRWKYQRYIKDYLRCVAAIDENVGRITDFLDEKGMADNTILIYTSDQGFFLGENGWYDKRWMYEPALRTPLFIRWPSQIPAGLVDDHLVQNIDIAPTILDWAGVDAPEGMHGHSLVSLVCGAAPLEWRDAIYYHYQEYNEGRTAHRVAEHDGVRTTYDKLIRVYRHDAWEYYDLRSDPYEEHNRINDPEVADRVATLKARLAEFKVEFDDQTGKPYRGPELDED